MMDQKQLEKYSDKTFATADTSQISSILLRTGSKDIESARIKLIVRKRSMVSRTMRLKPSAGLCRDAGLVPRIASKKPKVMIRKYILSLPKSLFSFH